MTIFNGRGLLVSLPGAEIAELNLPGSVCEPHEVSATAISRELRVALHMLRDQAAATGTVMKCLARPELFTNETALDWLGTHIEPSWNYLCLSDGSALKPLPPFATHVFFYRRASPEPQAALERLARRAPEFMTSLRAQINSCFRFGRQNDRVCPAAYFFGSTTPVDQPRGTWLPFYLNHHSAEDSANRIHQQDPMNAEALTGFAEAVYVPLTHTALGDRAYAAHLGETVLRACFTPGMLLLLRLPSLSQGETRLVQQLDAIIGALHRAGVIIPRLAAKNILLLTEDIEETHPVLRSLKLHIIIHDSFDFWRHGLGFYANASRVTVLSGPQLPRRPDFLPDDLPAVLGPNATWLRRADPLGD